MLCDYGTFIHRERVHSGMRQKDLAEKICTVDTISRIEKGSQTPTPVLFSLLAERLGVFGFSYGDFWEASTVQMLRLQIRIINGLDGRQLDDMPLLLGQYWDASKRTEWEKQFFLFVKGWYFFLADGNAENFLAACEEAMRVMRPHYQLGDDLSEANLIQNECRILNAAAILIEKEFHRKEGVILLNQLIVNQKSGKDFLATYWRNLAVLYNNAAICEVDFYPEMALKHIHGAVQAMLKSGNALLELRIARTIRLMFGGDAQRIGVKINELFLEQLFTVVNKEFRVYDSYWDFLNEPCFLQIL